MAVPDKHIFEGIFFVFSTKLGKKMKKIREFFFGFSWAKIPQKWNADALFCDQKPKKKLVQNLKEFI